VVLAGPADPAKLGVIRLRFRDDTGTVRPFRAFCQPGPAPREPLPPADVLGDGLSLGANWSVLEAYAGPAFRWVDNDAEVELDEPPPVGARLRVDLEPGPGLAGAPCRLTLRDAAGRELASACTAARAEVSLALPPDLKADSTLRLHVDGGGLATPPEPRILNFRVFRCELEGEWGR
jgi:hypothetical protein